MPSMKNIHINMGTPAAWGHGLMAGHKLPIGHKNVQLAATENKGEAKRLTQPKSIQRQSKAVKKQSKSCEKSSHTSTQKTVESRCHLFHFMNFNW